MTDLTAHPRYREARRRARNLRGFYVHALVFVLVNLARSASTWRSAGEAGVVPACGRP
jgi:hypothetical protein